jgi:hypothetical protein
MKECVTALIFVFMCGGEFSGGCIVSFYEQEHGRRWSGGSIETKKIYGPLH